MWVQCCSPNLILGATFGSPLIIVSSPWGKQRRMIFSTFSFPFPPSSLLWQLWRIFFFFYVEVTMFLLLSLLCSPTWSTPWLETGKRFLGGLFRVLPQGWTIMSGIQCGRTWASNWKTSPVNWKFTPNPLQNPVEMVKYIMEKCCASSREVQSYAICWALTALYWTLLDTRMCLQEEDKESKARRTVATQLHLNQRNSQCQ